MFTVKVPEDEDKEIVKKAVYKFVLDANEEIDEENPYEKKFEKMKSKLQKVPGVSGKKVDDLIEKASAMRFSVEEVDDGWKIINPFTSAVEDLPIVGGALGVSMKGFMGQSMSSLKSALKKMRYCEECDEIREEEVCSECENETEDFDFKVR